MKRKVSTLHPFPLTSDFTLPPPETKGEVRFNAEELAALIQETRESTAELVRNDLLAVEADKLKAVSDQLNASLVQIVNLAAHLEKARIDETDRRQALDTVRKLASTLIDGQGELFADN